MLHLLHIAYFSVLLINLDFQIRDLIISFSKFWFKTFALIKQIRNSFFFFFLLILMNLNLFHICSNCRIKSFILNLQSFHFEFINVWWVRGVSWWALLKQVLDLIAHLSDCEFVAGNLFFQGFCLNLINAWGLTILISAVSAASSNCSNFAWSCL